MVRELHSWRALLLLLLTSRLSPPYGGGEEIVINHVRAVKTVLDIFGISDVSLYPGRRSYVYPGVSTVVLDYTVKYLRCHLIYSRIGRLVGVASSLKRDGRPCGKSEEEEEVPVSPSMLQALRSLCTRTKRARHDTLPYYIVHNFAVI